MRPRRDRLGHRSCPFRQSRRIDHSHQERHRHSLTRGTARGRRNMKTLAIDIGGTKFSMAVFDGRCMIARESRATDREGGREWMMEQIYSIGSAWRSEYDFRRCGIGFGGPVIFADQRVALSTHVGGWNDFDLPRFIHRELHVPTVMDNDANAGALGEATHGAGQGCDPLFYMTLSTGIGGGIVHEGQIYRGADSYAG